MIEVLTVRMYATTTDLDDYLDPVPTDAEKYLGHASMLVRYATRCDVFVAQPNGLPQGEDLEAAFIAATCIHAAAMIRAEIDPDGGAVAIAEAAADQVTLGKAAISYGSTTNQKITETRTALLDGLCRSAYLVLRDVGLATGKVGGALR